jgi:hypothetical protein
MAAGQKCDSCGIETLEGQEFERENFAFGPMKRYCPNCYARLNRRIQTAYALLPLVMGAVGFMIVWRVPGNAFGQLLIGLCLLDLFLMLATVPHEFGHGIAGRLCGLNVRKIVIGFGPNIYIGRIWGLPVEFKLVPVGGLAYADPTSDRWWRAKMFAFIAAGPFTHVFALFAVHLLTGVSIVPKFSVRGSVAELYVLANWIDLIMNLAPFMATTSVGRIPSDGLALLHLLTASKGDRSALAFDLRKWKRFLRWPVAILLWAIAGLCYYLVGLCITDPTADRNLKIAVIGLVGFLGTALVWFGFRAFKDTPGDTQNTPLTPDVSEVFLQEIHASAAQFVHHPRMAEFKEHLHAGNLAEAERSLTALALPETNVFVAFTLGQLRERQGDPAGAEAMWLRARNQFSPRVAREVSVMIIQVQLKQGHLERARQSSRDLIAAAESVPEKLRIMDALACMPIMQGLRSFLEEADKISEQALALHPQNLTLKGTRGSLLIERGHLDEGVTILNEVYSQSEADNDKGISAFYLGLAAKAKGDIAAANRWAKKAKLLHPEEWLVKRVDAELSN